MNITFRTNLGSVDASKFDLDHKECKIGDTASVSDEVGESLVKSGLAESNTKVKAIAKASEITAPFKPATSEK